MQAILGAYKYKLRTSKTVVICVSAAALVILALVFVFPLIINESIRYGSFSVGSLFSYLVMFMMVRAARKDSKFLVTRPISRKSAHLSFMLYIVSLALFLGILDVLLQYVGYFTNGIMTKAYPNLFLVPTEADSWMPFTPSETWIILFGSFRSHCLTGIYIYCYTCLFTRWTAATISLTVGIPVAAFLLFVLPTVQSFILDFNRITDSSSSVITMVVVPQWIKLAKSIVDWFKTYFNIIYWTCAVCCIPISYIVMRKTRHISN